jgi:50S ribosomal protein L16 3-hydroxylase
MNTAQPLALLGGLSPTQFMKRHWQKKPFLVRNAIPGFVPCVGRNDLVALAAEEGVESRLIVDSPKGWKMKHGPFPKRSLPPFSQKKWTFLVQGVDMHHDGVHALMQQFRFVPDARLDDVMISYASDGGGVGPHFDSYDVFLLQAHGQRRWRIGRQKDLSLQAGVPLKILQNFEAEEEFVLNPGDMLYLPPKYAHDGVAEGECMTWSIGFRAPQEGELARELLMGLADEAFEGLGAGLCTSSDRQSASRSRIAGQFAGRVFDRAQSAGVVREFGVCRRSVWRCATRSAHQNDVRRAACVHQR